MPIIVYYGVPSHGKGLVDAMSWFGVKSPLRRVVITSNFCYKNYLDFCNYLTETFSSNDKKHYFVLDLETIAKRREDKQSLPIKLYREKYMISFSPDHSMQTKIYIWSCEECLKGAFTKCSYEAGKKFFSMTQVTMKIAKNLTLMMKPKMTPVKVLLKKMKSEHSVLWMQ